VCISLDFDENQATRRSFTSSWPPQTGDRVFKITQITQQSPHLLHITLKSQCFLRKSRQFQIKTKIPGNSYKYATRSSSSSFAATRALSGVSGVASGRRMALAVPSAALASHCGSQVWITWAERSIDVSARLFASVLQRLGGRGVGTRVRNGQPAERQWGAPQRQRRQGPGQGEPATQILYFRLVKK
jgi:hypothetical protein